MLKYFIYVACALVVSQANATSSVLIVGDSLTCGPFGQNLVVKLHSEGVSATAYCAVSSAPTHWLNGKNPAKNKTETWPCEKLQMAKNGTLLKTNCDGSAKVPLYSELIKKYPQHHLIIALGTNSLPNKANASYIAIVKLASENKNKACLFIGPPHIVRQDLEAGLNAFYNSLVPTLQTQQCHLVDSRPATAPGTAGYESVPDKVHKTSNAGKAWAQEILPEVLKNIN